MYKDIIVRTVNVTVASCFIWFNISWWPTLISLCGYGGRVIYKVEKS